MIHKYVSRLLSSDRGETYNVLSWPFIICMLSYGVGFVFFMGTTGVSQSTLFAAMVSFDPIIPLAWGIAAMLTIVIGGSYLLFRTPPFGRISGLTGFMVWVFAAFCWALTGGWLLFFAVAIPNMYFWIWQYFSLSNFNREDRLDKHTMDMYDAGQYDNEEHPKQGKIDREDNRGVSEDDRTPYKENEND